MTAAARCEGAHADQGASTRARRTPRRWPRRVATGVSAAIVLAVLAMAASITIVPAVLGGQTLAVLTGSMAPTIPPGSLVVVKPRPVAQIGAGDVITFVDRDRDSGRSHLVTHRVAAVERGQDGLAFVTKGDANRATDPQPVAATDVRGVVAYHLPWLGYLHGRVGLAAVLLYGGAAILLVLGGPLLYSAVRTRAAATQPTEDGGDGAPE